MNSIGLGLLLHEMLQSEARWFPSVAPVLNKVVKNFIWVEVEVLTSKIFLSRSKSSPE